MRTLTTCELTHTTGGQLDFAQVKSFALTNLKSFAGGAAAGVAIATVFANENKGKFALAYGAGVVAYRFTMSTTDYALSMTGL